MFENVEAWLAPMGPLIYLIVGLVIGIESMGIPLPGEVILVTAGLLSSKGAVNPFWVATAASIGAIVGDTIGYTVGRRGGRPLLDRLGKRFPKHLGPDKIVSAERMFVRWGVWAVFFGRFIALLRILAGPLAGVLKMAYPKFLVANALGGIVWAFGTTYVLYAVGHAAEKYLKGFGWFMLVAVLLCGLGTTAFLRHRAKKLAAKESSEPEMADSSPGQ